MKKCFVLLCFAVYYIPFLKAQNADSIGFTQNYYKMEKMIPMRDGIKLYTAFYIPKDSSVKHPVLLDRTPYGCAPYGEDNLDSWYYETFWLNYVREGYIFARQDVRGRYMSEGEFKDVRPFIPNKTGKEIDEASDAYDAIEWIVNRLPGNNGRVGAIGESYPGFYATMAALSGHPALKAVSPQAPVTDWFQGDDFHHNGAFFLMEAFGFCNFFGKPRPKPTTQESPGFIIPSQDNYDFYLRTGALKNFSRIMGDSSTFWNDLFAHPDYDDWWKARNIRNFVTGIKPAILVVGGLFDAENCFGAWNLYKAIEEKNKNTDNRLVMGPWVHGGWNGGADSSFIGNVRFGSKTSEYYQRNIEVPFFNFHLKQKGTVSDIAEANIFFTGENKWRRLEQWPPKNVEYKSMFIAADGRLSFENSSSKNNSFDEYMSDPAHPVPYTEDVGLRRTKEYMTDDQRFASRRTDVLTYSTGILTEDLTLAGPLVADIFTSISTTDADFVVKFIDVFPDEFKYDEKEMGKGNGLKYPMGGYQMLVRGEIMRGKFRNSLEKPEAFTPNKITEVKYSLPDIAHTFKKGHKLMIQIQSSWFPLADRNPQKFLNIYKAADSDFQKATIKIYNGGAYASKIILPVLRTKD